MISQALSVQKYVRTYCLERDLRQGSIEQINIAVRLLDRFTERETLLAELDDTLFNEWLVWLGAGGRKPDTVAGYRRSVLCLWRSAFDARLVDTEPRRVRKIRRAVTAPMAWCADEVRLILKVSGMIPGRCASGIPWKLWWPAYIRTAWDSALRRGDLLAITPDAIDSTGLLVVSQGKTGWPLVCRLRESTLAAIYATAPSTRSRLFPWDYGDRYFSAVFSRIVAAAGVRPGTSKWLRRGSATAVEAMSPGAATRHLGHQTHGLAMRHYVDPRLLPVDRPMPPEL